MEPNTEGVCDLVGPLKSFCQTAAGHPRYIFVYVDNHTRFVITYVLSSAADNQIYEAILHTPKYALWPSRQIADG